MREHFGCSGWPGEKGKLVYLLLLLGCFPRKMFVLLVVLERGVNVGWKYGVLL